jgi:2-amino-4-hydroxy-6-hydroxymethyldihydropteridine diphosphokinase
MLDLIQSIEQRLGRERRVRWDARSIDIDLVLYGNWIGQELRLTLPHPRLAARAFVLVPACDIAADWTDPRCGWTIQQLAEHLERQVPSLALSGSGREQRAELCQRLAARGVWTIEEPVSPTVIEVRGQAPIWRGSPDPAAEQIAVGPSFEPPADRPWVSAFVPPLPADPSADSFRAPRVVARLECSPETEPWPSPHQLWPGHGGDAVRGWPEYWIRGSDLAWMEGELQAALDSMRCDLHPITASGDW